MNWDEKQWQMFWTGLFWSFLISLAASIFILYLQNQHHVDVTFWNWVFGCRHPTQCSA